MNRKLVVLLSLTLLAVLAVVPAFAQDPAEVPVWIAFTDANRLGWAQDRAAEFNAAFPQYNVTIQGYANYEELFAATALAAEQGSLPAVVQYFEVATQVARDSGYFKSIASALGDRTEINGISTALDDIIGPVAAYYTLDGEFTSMPWNTSSAIWFSNMNILNAAGIDTPPATWAEIDAACEAIMALPEAPEYCWTFPNHGWFFEQWLAQQDAVFANNDNGRTERATEVAFNSDAGVAILNWMREQQDKGYLYYSGAQGGDSWGTVDQAFGAQQVAMAAYSSSDTAVYTQTGVDNGYEVVASFLPYNDATGWTGNLIGGASLWLVDGLSTEVEDGALSFLFWMTNTENAASWHQTTGYIAIRQSAVDQLTAAGWYDENPNFRVASDQLAASTVTPATSGALLGAFPQIRNVVTQAIDTVLLTPDADPATVLNDAAAEANTILEEYNLLNVE
ncbi:MAG: extracellular solute-binding protein [Chloroflexi bacterium]|uniref:extracellular solute-binding protein n=1 Tax=Candidatus Flexifilum breve TaxID=3140694 RepID=UPI00313683BC|nr:extracellular solute-binding protein [Chloroflexota bacterium]